ncbi:MAG: hypothetical protein P8Y23_16700 [Candidatus Lokiarchaeota archaeon]
MDISTPGYILLFNISATSTAVDISSPSPLISNDFVPPENANIASLMVLSFSDRFFIISVVSLVIGDPHKKRLLMFFQKKSNYYLYSKQ